MNNEEAEKIAKILITADCRCEICASSLFQEFNKQFPNYEAILDRVWKEDGSDGDWRVKQ